MTDPTNSPSHRTARRMVRPGYGGITGDRDPLARQLIAHGPDRVVVTWFASETRFYTALPPEQADHFQAVLRADSAARRPRRCGRASRATPS